ncbi:hypothetical protein [Acinetobacter pittii]|uniref:hypothetical protein n=1 Tax=Acinetobacter pittii TaxID=48296 RepID=UPI0019819586|nr:hypothetical protein [Acinetobacter pittii]MBN6535007.1 hypothetical protein [Acinetobacter pittii]
MIDLHQCLPVKYRRIGILISCVVVLGVWSLTLPPTDSLEFEKSIINYKKEEKSDAMSWYSLQAESPNLGYWDLPLIHPQIEKTIQVSKKPTPIEKKKIVNKPPVLPQQIIPLVNEQSPIATVSLPQVKYLGQVVDNSGLQIFLSIDDSNVVMQPKRIYDQIWQIIGVDKYEIRLLHIPSNQILHINKS